MPAAPIPAYVVDFDEESGHTVRGTKKSAREKAPKISQRDSDKTKRRSRAHDNPPERERSVRIPQKESVGIITEREKHGHERERRKSSSGNSLQSPKKVRPPSAHKNKSFPQVDESHHFGVQPPLQPSSARPAPPVLSQSMQPTMSQHTSRPRALTAHTSPYPGSRPISYHGVQSSNAYHGPPLSSSAWSNHHPPAIIPASPAVYGQSPNYPYQQQYHVPAVPSAPSSDYFSSQASSVPDRPMSTRPLSLRFEAPARTGSGFGMGDSQPQEQDFSYYSYYDDGYTSASDGTARRRESIRMSSRTPSRLSRGYDADFAAMPPPPRPSESRPSILRRPGTDYAPVGHAPVDPYYREGRQEERSLIRDDSRPRRSSTHRNSVTYDLPSPRERDVSRTRHANSHRNSASYDLTDAMGRVTLEPAKGSNQGRRRTQSYYGQSAATSGHTGSSASSALEDKLRKATIYQEDVAGPAQQLTADLLKKQQRRQGGSSRSTKSSASRDESDYRKSATTRTTRSGSGNDDENVTIKVTGRAQVNVGGAQIDCPDGGEIEIKRRQRGIQGGSERSVSEYGAPYAGQQQIEERERQTRSDRPSGRSRMSSQHSYTRSTRYFGDNYF